MSSQFDTVGMPSFNSNTPVAGGLKDTKLANPNGDVVDRTAGDNPINPVAQGLSTNQGAYIEGQARPSTLY